MSHFDVEQALDLVVERAPDLLLLNWMLPRISNIEFGRQFRRKSEAVDTPIIMLTARTEEDDRLRGLNTGADDYVTKPFSQAVFR